MTNILVNIKHCKIENELDTDLLQKLDRYLTFKYVGAEFTPAFKYHHWNGLERLMSKKLEFMTGLLQYVIDFYKQNNKEVNIIDNRQQFIPGTEIDISKRLAKIKITPYDYQEAAVSRALESDRLILKHATGSGKTLSAALITAKLGKPTTIYVISINLLYQFYEFFKELFGDRVGMIGDGICIIGDINIISIQTAGRALGMKKNETIIEDTINEKFNEDDKDKIVSTIKKAKIHIFDEAHVCATKTIKKIYKVIEPEKLIAMSGTFCRDDGADLLLQGIMGNNDHIVSASELIKRGILAKPFIKFNYVKGYSHFTETYQTVYSNHIVNNEYRNNLIVSETNKLLEKNYQVLVLFKTIAHGKILRKLFEDKNIDCEFLTGKDTAKVREKVKQKMLSRESNLLIASQIYDIGVDIKTLSALVLAGSGRSSVKSKQRIGRVLRDGKNKPYAAVIEIFDDVRFLKKHALIRKSIYETEPEFDIKFPDIKKK